MITKLFSFLTMGVGILAVLSSGSINGLAEECGFREYFDGSNCQSYFWNWKTDSAGTTQTTPVLTPFTNREVLQTHVGTDSNIYQRKSFDGVNFLNWIKSEGQTTLPVATIKYGSRLVQVHRGQDKWLYIRETTTQDSIGSYGWSRLNAMSDHEVSLTISNGYLCMTHVGLDGKIYTGCQKDIRANYNWQQFVGTTTQPVTQTTFANGIYQLHRGDDTHIYSRVCKITSASMSPTLSCTSWSREPGDTDLPIAVSAITSSSTIFSGQKVTTSNIFMIHRGQDQHLYVRYVSYTQSATENYFNYASNWKQSTAMTDSAVSISDPFQLCSSNNCTDGLGISHRGLNDKMYIMYVPVGEMLQLDRY
jgi:hypothetical protein